MHLQKDISELVIEPESSVEFLFDVSLEVCNKVGGVYSVLSSKVPYVTDVYGDAYCALGPYVPSQASVLFEELAPNKISQVLEKLTALGVPVKYGRWLVEGFPKTVLFELYIKPGTPAAHFIEEAKRKLDSRIADISPRLRPPVDPYANDDTNWIWNTFLFGCYTALFFREFSQWVDTDPDFVDGRIVASFHEWNAGCGLLLLDIFREQWNMKPIATLFTLHACYLARCMLAAGYSYGDFENWGLDDEMNAGKLNIYVQHMLEKKAAFTASTVCAVSELTARDAKWLLHKNVDVITPNGLHGSAYDVPHHLQILHKEFKERLNEYVSSTFIGIDTSNVIYMFTAGRYEIKNKGMDLTIDALKLLKEKLMKDQSESRPTVICFFITPIAHKHTQISTLQSVQTESEIRSCIDRICDDIRNNIYNSLMITEMQDGVPTFEKPLKNFVKPKEIIALKRFKQQLIYRSRNPPLCIHELKEDNNELVWRLRQAGLTNEDVFSPVKIQIHADFLDATTSPIGLNYSDFVRACHVGIFPSFYEPFGLTSWEAAALACCSINSNLAGSGRIIEQSDGPSHPLEHGRYENFWLESPSEIYVADRTNISGPETADRIASVLYQYTKLSLSERVEVRNKTSKYANEKLTWSTLIEDYWKAVSLAKDRAFK